ncbi:MAG TPA: hypothetical protein VFY06_00260 [Verrucomicrobiae bacterium]|nr:hypothetical protein [Verrucomicrobiae bacterium]
MPMELQIIRAHEFVRVGPQGNFDLKASKAALAALAGACRKRGINQALVDLRALHPGPTPVFSPNDLVVLVNTFREVGFTLQERLAILYGSDPHHRARLFAFIAKLRGWSVQAFDNYEKAILWLSGAGPNQPEAEHTPQPGPVPVRTRAGADAAAKSAEPLVIPIKSKPASGGKSRKKSTTSQRRRQRVMRIMKTSVVLFIAGVLMATAIGCSTAKHSNVSQETQDMLVAAGFKMVNATTPGQQAHLRTLPPGKIATAKHDDKVYYVYPDAAHRCIYVGNRNQYLAFVQASQDAQLSAGLIKEADFQMDAAIWDFWGYGDFED